MSLTDLQVALNRQVTLCGPGGIGPDPRRYVEERLAPTDITEYIVDPSASASSDAIPFGPAPAPSGTVFRTIMRALREIPHVAPDTPGSPLTRAFVITLRRDTDYWYDDPSGGMRGERYSPTPSDGNRRGVEWWDGGRLHLEQRMGVPRYPIIIMAEGDEYAYTDEFGNPRASDLRPRLRFRLSLRSVQYVYLKNLRVLVPGTVESTLDAVQIQSYERPADADPAVPTPAYLRTHHVLIRGCEIDGGWRPGGVALSGEALKVNQSQSIFVEASEIHGAGADNGNCVDFVAVQYGHVVDCHLHQSRDWCIYVKGGSAFIRVEGNRIHGELRPDGSVRTDGTPRGFSAGEGTDSNALAPPWWHFEAYAIQFVNNLVYNLPDTGIGVQGGHHVLIAHNTVYNVGLGFPPPPGEPNPNSSQMISLGYGERECPQVRRFDMTIGNHPQCGQGLRAALSSQDSWATTTSSSNRARMVPNRYVSILNNVLLIDYAPGQPSPASFAQFHGFNVFSIAPEIRDQTDTEFGGDRDAMGNLEDEYPRNLPFPLRADGRVGMRRTLTVAGNFVAVREERNATGMIIPITGRLPQDILIDNRYDDRDTFYSNFNLSNRDDGTRPAVDLTDPNSRESFLRPTSGPTDTRSVFNAAATSRSAMLPDATATWDMDLPPLPTGVPPRDTPWREMNQVPLDMDRICRRDSRVPGARVWLPGASDEFYVRDWFRSPTMSDDGREPSSEAAFYTSSDVWNRHSSDVASATDAGGVPLNQYPRMGMNYAFARVRRNASGSPQRVSAHFMSALYGTGNPFQELDTTPDSYVSFGPAESERIVQYQWQLPATMTGHLCFAVEISAPGDPFQTPSLRGMTPGWPVTDTAVVRDNNKAQRNMDPPPASMGMSMMSEETGEVSDGAGMMSLFAIARNAATYPRDMELRYEMRDGAESWLRNARFEISGEKDELFKPGSSLVLRGMQPGESRWIGLTFDFSTVGVKELPPVLFYEMVEGVPVNGFALGLRLTSTDAVVRENLMLHAAVFSRMAAVFGIRGAEEASVQTLRLSQMLRERKRPAGLLGWICRLLSRLIRTLTFGRIRLCSWKRTGAGEYVKHLHAQRALLTSSVAEFYSLPGARDVFGVQEALERLSTLSTKGDPRHVAVAHSALLGKLDSSLTMLQKEQGDPAEILHNVLWQRDLYSNVPQLRNQESAAAVREKSEQFLRAYGAREVDNADYPTLVKELLPSFRETQRLLGAGFDLTAEVEEMERNLDSPPRLQKAHRSYLLRLQAT